MSTCEEGGPYLLLPYRHQVLAAGRQLARTSTGGRIMMYYKSDSNDNGSIVARP